MDVFCEAVVSQCFTHVLFKFSPRKLGVSWSNVTVAHIFFNQLGGFWPTNPPAKKVKNSCISCVFMKLVFMIYIVASSWNMKPVQVGLGGVGRSPGRGGLFTGPGPVEVAPPSEVSKKISFELKKTQGWKLDGLQFWWSDSVKFMWITFLEGRWGGFQETFRQWMVSIWLVGFSKWFRYCPRISRTMALHC